MYSSFSSGESSSKPGGGSAGCAISKVYGPGGGIGLIIAKILAGRPKDVDDSRALWKLHGSTLDSSRIRRLLQLLDEALTESDLVTSFEAVTASVPRREP